MRRPRSQAENIDGLKESLEAIEIGLAAYKSGRLLGWHLIVTELFKLLMDKKHSGPLAVIIFPSLAFHPMFIKDLPTDIPPAGPNQIHSVFSQRIRLTTGQTEVEVTMFDESMPKIPLESWLKQTLMVNLNHQYSIGQYIDILRHGEAAHFGKEIGPGLENTRGLTIRAGGKTQTNLELYVAGLGKYVLKQLKEDLHELDK